MEFKDKLRELRNRRKWSRPDLAKKAGISAKAIEKYETGEREPTANSVVLLAEALDVPVETLYGDKEIKDPDTEAFGYTDNLTAMFAGGKISAESREEIFRLINIAYVEAIQKDVVREKKTNKTTKSKKKSNTKSNNK